MQEPEKEPDGPDDSHYKAGGGVEPFDFIRSNGMSFLQGNIIKYTSRYKYKGKPLEDLKKAQVYLGWLIEEVEAEGRDNEQNPHPGS